jgi:MoxR-like ATPase
MFVGLMIGPSGYGKTTIPMKFAEKTGRKFVRVNCSAVRDPEEWLGFREARSGDTIFEPTEFAQALMGGNSVIVLDEVNRIEPWLHNTLFPLLDFSHKTVVHNKEFVVGPNTIVMMTMNRGLEYVGTFELDQAFINRSDVVMMVGAPPATEEVQILVQRTSIEKSIASRIVNLLASLRSTVKEREIIVDCSTRAALKIANLVKAGASLREAFHDTIEIASINSEDMKKIADIMNSAIGTFESIRPPANQDAFLG